MQRSKISWLGAAWLLATMLNHLMPAKASATIEDDIRAIERLIEQPTKFPVNVPNQSTENTIHDATVGEGRVAEVASTVDDINRLLEPEAITEPRSLLVPQTENSGHRTDKTALDVGVSFQEIYELAKLNDPRILAAEFEKQTAQLEIPIARADRRPQLSFQADREYEEADLLADPERENRSVFALTLDVPIYNKRSQLNIGIAGFSGREAELNFQQQQQVLFLRTAELYFGVLRAEDNIQIAEAAQKAIQSQVDQAARSLALQVIPKFQLFEARASLESMNASVIEAENELSAAREALRVAIGQYPPRLARLESGQPLDLQERNDIEHWLAVAQQNNVALRLAKLQIERARLETRMARASRYPTLGLLSSYQWTKSDIDANDDTTSREVALQFRLPLYNGGRIAARESQAYKRLLQLEQQLALAERSVEQQVRTAHGSVNTALRRSAAFEKALESSQVSLDSIEGGIRVGVNTTVELLDVVSRQTQAQQALTASRYDYLLNYLSLLAFSGEPIHDAIEILNRIQTN